MQRTRVLWVSLVVLGLALFLTGCEVTSDDGVEHLVLNAAWDATAADPDFDGAIGSTYVVTFPAGGTEYGFWGEYIYTDDSAIGTAAVWEGRIDFLGGGTVKIEILDGQASYAGGTTAWGVTSQSYGAWDRSFQFLTYP